VGTLKTIVTLPRAAAGAFRLPLLPLRFKVPVVLLKEPPVMLTSPPTESVKPLTYAFNLFFARPEAFQTPGAEPADFSAGLVLPKRLLPRAPALLFLRIVRHRESTLLVVANVTAIRRALRRCLTVAGRRWAFPKQRQRRPTPGAHF
jgi:hypothetical protein